VSERNDQLVRKELERILRQQAFSQSVGEQLVNVLLANNNYLPMTYQPSRHLLTTANGGLLAREYLGRGATASPSRLLAELKHFPARAWAHCSHPLLRLALVSADGTMDDDVKRYAGENDPRWSLPTYVSPVTMAVKVICKPLVSKDGMTRLLPHAWVTPEELHTQLADYATRVTAANALEPLTLIAFVDNCPRGDANSGRVRFLNLPYYINTYIGKAKMTRDGGREVQTAALRDDHELWLTPRECAKLIAPRYAAIGAGDDAQKVVTLVDDVDADHRPALICAGSGRLALRTTRVDKGTGDRTKSFAAADYCVATGGLFIRDHVLSEVIEAVDAITALADLADTCAQRVNTELENIGVAVNDNHTRVRVNVNIDPFASAYAGELRLHPAGYTDAEQLVANAQAGKLPVVANVRTIPAEALHAQPPVTVNDVEWPDCGPWLAVDRR